MRKTLNKTDDALANDSGAMEDGDHFKNGASLMNKGIWKLLPFFILLIATFVFNSCKKDQNEKKGENTEIPEYIGIKNLEEFDYAILGLDGNGYFFKFQDENQNIPQQIIIYDGNNDNTEMIVNFDEDGLAKNILTEDVTIVLGNYAGNRFDAVVITKDGESQLLKNIETDLYWDDYKNSLLSGEMLSGSSDLKSFNFSGGLTALSAFLNGISCIMGNFISCVNLGVIVAQVLGLDLTVLDISYNLYGLLTCSTADFFGCLASIAGILSYEADMRYNSRIEYIRSGEEIIALNAFVGIWQGWYADGDGMVTLTINEDFMGVFAFERTGCSGSYNVSVDYYNDVYNVRGTTWIYRPNGCPNIFTIWSFANLIGGTISNDVLSGTDFRLEKVE